MSSPRSRFARRAVSIAAAALFAACASRQSTATTNQAGAPRNTHNTLSAVDLKEAGTSNLLEAIQKLRPEFLKTRGTGTIAAIPMPTSSRGAGRPTEAPDPAVGNALPISGYPLKIYENDVMLGGVEDLRRIDTKNVVEVRFVPGPEAGVRYGTNHQGGVIFVKTL